MNHRVDGAKSRRMRPAEAAKYVGLPESKLAKLRMGSDGPPFIKVHRSVLYDTRDLDDWLERNKISK